LSSRGAPPAPKRNPADRSAGFPYGRLEDPYWADDIVGTSTDMAGASLDDGAIGVSDDGAIGVSLDMTITDISEDIELIIDSTEESADEMAGASDDDGAADDDGASLADGAGASLELTAELDGSTGVTGVGVPRLKIQIRPTITITATMMIIQVLRFIWCLPLFGGDETGRFVLFDALPPPVRAASNFIRRWRH
jgi:hypothetical protein